MNIAIIDYGSGNLRSCAKAFEHVAPGRVKVTAHAADLRQATHIVLPGVGAFGDCMRGLTAIPGMREALEEEVRQKQKPFLGICVGMQMMMQRGFEHGEHAGLGWLMGEVRPLTPHNLKVPHMGWNELQVIKSSPALTALKSGDHAYFVHSYHVRCSEDSDVLVTSDYGGPVAAIIGRDNLLGTQFHPEKSQQTGFACITGFLSL